MGYIKPKSASKSLLRGKLTTFESMNKKKKITPQNLAVITSTYKLANCFQKMYMNKLQRSKILYKHKSN